MIRFISVGGDIIYLRPQDSQNKAIVECVVFVSHLSAMWWTAYEASLSAQTASQEVLVAPLTPPQSMFSA